VVGWPPIFGRPAMLGLHSIHTSFYFHPPLHLAPIMLTPLTKSTKSKASSFYPFSKVLFIYF
jgi:hypothetical protein